MVFTRGQKRKFEEVLDTNLNDNINDHINDNINKISEDINKKQGTLQMSNPSVRQGTLQMSNPSVRQGSFNIIIKKKKTQTESGIETNEGNESEIETTEETNESEIETTEETNESEIETNEGNESGIETTEETNENKTSTKTTAQNLETIIKTSLANLVSKFTKNEKPSDEPKDEPKDEYDKYLNYVDSIYDGDFFESESIDDKKKKLKNLFSDNDIKKLNIELQEIKTVYNKRVPNIVNILKMDMHVSQKQKLLEKMYHFMNSDILSADYNSNLKYLISNINSDENSELVELEKQILEKSNSIEYSDNYRQKILKSKMPFENKIITYKRLEVMESFESTDTSEYAKYKSWMDILLSIPYQKPINNKIDKEDSKKFIKCVRDTLDARLSFLETAKDQVLNIVTQMVRNPDNNCLPAIGLYGERGVGKTAFVKSISEALGRPYRTISLGGESDSSSLTGHGFTYVGSGPGRIIEILRETQCTNPIILFDELDKVSETYRGKEIIGNLIHLTDSTSNDKYNYDKYFAGLEFDLSKVLFIFTYNDETKVDPILADRLFKIRVNNYSVVEKLEIAKTHLIKTILSEYSFKENEIEFEDDAIHYIVETSRSDQGMRDVKRKFEIIISRVNTLLLTDPEQNIIRLKYKDLYNYYKLQSDKIRILKDHVDIFLTDSIIKKVDDGPPPGMYM